MGITSYLLGYFFPILICVGILLWIRLVCDRKIEFPTRGAVIALSLASLLPILNILEACILIVIYILERVDGNYELKKNKFGSFLNG